MPRICFINKMDRMGANFEKSYASILDRLTKHAVRMQLPIGAEAQFDGVVDLLTMKAYKFEGEMGSVVTEYEIPENLKADADKYHAELVEKIVEHDDALMTSRRQRTDYRRAKGHPAQGCYRQQNISCLHGLSS